MWRQHRILRPERLLNVNSARFPNPWLCELLDRHWMSFVRCVLSRSADMSKLANLATQILLTKLPAKTVSRGTPFWED